MCPYILNSPNKLIEWLSSRLRKKSFISLFCIGGAWQIGWFSGPRKKKCVLFIHTRFTAEDSISKYKKTRKKYHAHSSFVDFMIHELSWVSIAMIKHQNQPGEERVDFSDFSLQLLFTVHLPSKSGRGVRNLTSGTAEEAVEACCLLTCLTTWILINFWCSQ